MHLTGSNGLRLPVTSGESKARYYTRLKNAQEIVARLETDFPGITFAIEGDEQASVHRIRCQTETSAAFYVSSSARIPEP